MKHRQATTREKPPKGAKKAPVRVFYNDGIGSGPDHPAGWYWWLFENGHPIGWPQGPFPDEQSALDGYIQTLNEAN